MSIVSDAPFGGDAVVRVYWNVTSAGAPALVRAITSRLNAAGAPFGLKVADHAWRLTRCDGAVLYVSEEVFRAWEGELRETASALAPLLRRSVPAFTLELAGGVGLAEHPGGAVSFGAARCALLADGIVRARERGVAGIDAAVAVVAERFAEDGVRLDAPYLEPSLAGRHVL